MNARCECKRETSTERNLRRRHISCAAPREGQNDEGEEEASSRRGKRGGGGEEEEEDEGKGAEEMRGKEGHEEGEPAVPGECTDTVCRGELVAECDAEGESIAVAFAPP